MFEVGDTVKTKKSCCSSSPRCKRCPIVWRRMARNGFVSRTSKRRYVVVNRMKRRDVARARRG